MRAPVGRRSSTRARSRFSAGVAAGSSSTKALALHVLEWLGQPLWERGQVDGERQVAIGPLLEGGEAQEGAQGHQAALPRGRAVPL